MTPQQLTSTVAKHCARLMRRYDERSDIDASEFLSLAQDVVREIQTSGMNAVDLLFVYNFLVTARTNFTRWDEMTRQAQKSVTPSQQYDEAVETIALEVARKVPSGSQMNFLDPVSGKRLRSQVMRAQLYRRSQRFPMAAIAFA